MKDELKKAKKSLEDIHNQNLADQAKYNAKIYNLTLEVDNKEMEVLKQKNEVAWANEKIVKLETALQTALQDLKTRGEFSDQWESKAGELHQKIIDLERFVNNRAAYFKF
jgi:uncharacterized coiled-coil DUF342 family protein